MKHLIIYFSKEEYNKYLKGEPCIGHNKSISHEKGKAYPNIMMVHESLITLVNPGESDLEMLVEKDAIDK